MDHGKKYAVFSIRKLENGSTVWVRAGAAWANKDGSANVYLDVLPLDGKLHIREPGEKRDEKGHDKQSQLLTEAAASMGGH